MAKSMRKTTKVVAIPRLVSATSVSSRLTDTDIAKRAFELYCDRGRQDGYDIEDWLQAERELVEKSNSTAA